jgi:hypothetical protein
MSCDNDIGSASPGYARSPPLLHQINVIHSNEGIDYFLIPAKSSKEPYAAVFQDLAVKTCFRRDRATAMTSGDRDAVAAIGQLLVRQASGISRRSIRILLKLTVVELNQWSIRRLCKIEAKSIFKFVDTTRALLNNGPRIGGNPR